MMPSQKSGMLIPAMTNPSPAIRQLAPRLAEKTPSGTPTNVASIIARSVSSRVTGSAVASSDESGAPDDVVPAEVAVEQTAEPTGVLGEQRAVEAEVGADHGDVLRRRPEAEHRPHRVARDQVDEQEHEHAEREQHRDGDQQAAGDEQHRDRSSPRCGVAVDRGPDATEHLLGEPEVLTRQPGGALGVAVHDRGNQRRVLLECPAAQDGRVRLGEEAERHLGAQLGRQLEQVAVVGGGRDRPVQCLVGRS